MNLSSGLGLILAGSCSGTIVEESSRLLILLYPFSIHGSKLVEEIRRDYKELFQQESVLRVDDLSCVSF